MIYPLPCTGCHWEPPDDVTAEELFGHYLRCEPLHVLIGEHMAEKFKALLS